MGLLKKIGLGMIISGAIGFSSSACLTFLCQNKIEHERNFENIKNLRVSQNYGMYVSLGSIFTVMLGGYLGSIERDLERKRRAAVLAGDWCPEKESLMYYNGINQFDIEWSPEKEKAASKNHENQEPEEPQYEFMEEPDWRG